MNLPNSPKYSPSPTLSATGAILLDVENFPLKLDLAKYLKAYCKYDLTIKFAVANWQNNSISKLDKYLHQQGYQLIHVPKDKNAADAQILTLGAALQLNYPQVKDVVIVSHDFIFNYLHQALQRQGCNTYKVYQQSGNIFLDDFIGDRPALVTKLSHLEQKQNNEQKKDREQKLNPKQKPNPEKIIKRIIEKTLVELSQTSELKITLSKLGSEFKTKHQKKLSEIIKEHTQSGSTLNFIKQNCANKINVETQDKIHYLSIIGS